jgi:hypothetical protein
MMDKGNFFGDEMFLVTDSSGVTSCRSDLRNKFGSKKYNETVLGM